MTLDTLYMPLPAGVSGRVVKPLGEFEEAPTPRTPQEQREHDRIRNAAYRERNREARNQRQREWKAARK